MEKEQLERIAGYVMATQNKKGEPTLMLQFDENELNKAHLVGYSNRERKGELYTHTNSFILILVSM